HPRHAAACKLAKVLYASDDGHGIGERNGEPPNYGSGTALLVGAEHLASGLEPLFEQIPVHRTSFHRRHGSSCNGRTHGSAATPPSRRAQAAIACRTARSQSCISEAARSRLIVGENVRSTRH